MLMLVLLFLLLVNADVCMESMCGTTSGTTKRKQASKHSENSVMRDEIRRGFCLFTHTCVAHEDSLSTYNRIFVNGAER